ACNLASMNLLAFRDDKTQVFDVEGYEHAIRLWTVVLEIAVLMAQFPSRQIALLSYEFRTLGLGYANLGGPFVSSRPLLRLGARPTARGLAPRDHDRDLARARGGEGKGARPLPGQQEDPRSHAARDPQPPPRRARRALGLREGRAPASAARPQGLSGP